MRVERGRGDMSSAFRTCSGLPLIWRPAMLTREVALLPRGPRPRVDDFAVEGIDSCTFLTWCTVYLFHVLILPFSRFFFASLRERLRSALPRTISLSQLFESFKIVGRFYNDYLHSSERCVTCGRSGLWPSVSSSASPQRRINERTLGHSFQAGFSPDPSPAC